MTRDEFDTIILETLEAMQTDESSKEENEPETWGLEYDMCQHMSCEEFRVMCLTAVQGWLNVLKANNAQNN
jgi:uncharacterized UBP type Zn finger protein